MTAEPLRAAGVLIQAPTGRVLMLKRSSVGDAAGQWSFPGGKIEEDEDAAGAANRECKEETGYLPGSLAEPIATRLADGVHFTTFHHKAEEEFTPKLNSEHTAWAWVLPREALDEHEGHVAATMPAPASPPAPGAPERSVGPITR
jgi:8-oxo-dGTP pyrophosphatase MutT (NUDIX family)